MATFDKFRSVYTHDELMERLRGIKHVALDMDGTIYMIEMTWACRSSPTPNPSSKG